MNLPKPTPLQTLDVAIDSLDQFREELMEIRRYVADGEMAPLLANIRAKGAARTMVELFSPLFESVVADMLR